MKNPERWSGILISFKSDLLKDQVNHQPWLKPEVTILIRIGSCCFMLQFCTEWWSETNFILLIHSHLYTKILKGAQFMSDKPKDNCAPQVVTNKSASTWWMKEERKVSLLALIDTSWPSVCGFPYPSLILDLRGEKQFVHDPTIAPAASQNDLELLAFLLTVREGGMYVEVVENPRSDWNSWLKLEKSPWTVVDGRLRATCITDEFWRCLNSYIIGYHVLLVLGFLYAHRQWTDSSLITHLHLYYGWRMLIWVSSQASEVSPKEYLIIFMSDSYRSHNIFGGGARVGTVQSS